MPKSSRRHKQRPPEPLNGPGERRTGSAVACDMRYGPCACGAWHDDQCRGRTLLEALWGGAAPQVSSSSIR